MDLNIGTAFWFASKGVGAIKDYSAVEIETTYMNITDENGRPLLRVGDGDAALSVGLSEWKEESIAKKKSNKQCMSSVDIYITQLTFDFIIMLIGEDDEDGDDQSGTDKMKCNVVSCGRYSKLNCIKQMCKRCCLKIQKAILHGNSDGASVASIKLNGYCQAHRMYSQSSKPLGDSIVIGNKAKLSFNKIGIPYVSNVKALLIGIGADEQMAGYGRHRTAFVRHSKDKNLEQQILQKQYDVLNEELNKDLQRLWQRNLGR